MGDKEMYAESERPITVDRVLSPAEREKILEEKSLPVRLLDRLRDAMRRNREDQRPKRQSPHR